MLVGGAVIYAAKKIYNYFDPPLDSPDTRSLHREYLERLSKDHRKLTLLDKHYEYLESAVSTTYPALLHKLVKASNDTQALLKKFETGTTRKLLIASNLALSQTCIVEFLHCQIILNACTQNLISNTAVPLLELKLQLERLQKELDEQGYNLGLPIDHISAYYTFPLVQCQMDLPNTTITIALEVSFVPKDLEVKVAEIFSLEFLHQRPRGPPEFCRLFDTHSCIAVMGNLHRSYGLCP